MIDASELVILTSNEQVTITDENGTSTELKELSIEEANLLTEANKLDAITTLPKIQAALNFVVAKKGRKAVITNLEKAKAGIRGKIGTIIS